MTYKRYTSFSFHSIVRKKFKSQVSVIKARDEYEKKFFALWRKCHSRNYSTVEVLSAIMVSIVLRSMSAWCKNISLLPWIDLISFTRTYCAVGSKWAPTRILVSILMRPIPASIPSRRGRWNPEPPSASNNDEYTRQYRTRQEKKPKSKFHTCIHPHLSGSGDDMKRYLSTLNALLTKVIKLIIRPPNHIKFGKCN